MGQPSPTPTAARALIFLVSVAGVAALVARVGVIGEVTGRDLLALAFVAVAVVVADRFTFPLPHGDDTEHFMLSDGVWTAALLLAAPGVPTFGAALGTVTWQLASRWPLRKVVFNTAQVAVALTLAETVFGLGDGRPDPLEPTTWMLAAAAMAVASVVNFGLVALVIALVQGERFRAVLLGPWRVNLMHWVGNVSVGLMAAVLWQVNPSAVVLLALPCILLSLAYRDWVRSTIEANEMEAMMKGAEAIARGRAFEARLPVGERRGRLPELATALNHMLDQLELALHRQRQLMADVAGRLRRPIAEIARALGDPDTQRSHGNAGADTYREMQADLDRVHRILDDMADIGCSQLPGYVELQPVRIAELVKSITRKAEPFLGDRLHATGPATSFLVALDRDRIEEALLRLLRNTADHAAGSRPVIFRTFEEDGTVLFEVVDEGGGVPAGHEEAIFEPFYRLGPRRDGVGLGLALVRTVAEAHGGSAGVVNRPGAGVTFWVRVPR
jgi:signal transduction histidine kinase